MSLENFFIISGVSWLVVIQSVSHSSSSLCCLPDPPQRSEEYRVRLVL